MIKKIKRIIKFLFSTSRPTKVIYEISKYDIGKFD